MTALTPDLEEEEEEEGKSLCRNFLGGVTLTYLLYNDFVDGGKKKMVKKGGCDR